jgi:hypothetical protein
VSATSSAQSHGGARRADFRPPLLRPVPPGTNARAYERSLASSIIARVKILSRQVGFCHSKVPKWTAVTEGRGRSCAHATTCDGGEEDSHA